MLKYVRGEIQKESHFAFYWFMYHLSPLPNSTSVQLGKATHRIVMTDWLKKPRLSYFACLGNWNNNSAWLRVLWEWSIKAQYLTHNWYSTNIKLFQKNTELMCTSSLKNGKEAYQILSGHYSHDSWNQIRLHLEPRAVCFQVSSACHHEATSLPTVMGILESTWLLHFKALPMSECQRTMSEGRTNPRKCFKSSEHIRV